MQVVPLEPPRRLRGDTGAALAEAALITPVFVYILFGILEMSLVFRTWITLGSAVQDGARRASVLGKSADADYEIIQAVKKSMSPVPQAQIKNLVVWRASSGASSVVNPLCTAATTRSQFPGAGCNVYTPNDDWGVPAAQEGNYNCTTPGWSSGFCPTTRKTAATNFLGNGPPEFIGITITVNHKYLTGLFGTTKVINDTAITQLEPQSLV